MRILKIKTPTDLTQSVEKDLKQGINMVGVFADWCHNCRDMQPEWEKFTNSMKNERLNGKIITIYEPAYRQSKCKTCFDKVMGYPTIMMLKDGVQTGEFKGMPREMEYFRKYAKENMREIMKIDSDARNNERIEKKIMKVAKKIKKNKRLKKATKGLIKARKEMKKRSSKRKKTKKKSNEKKLRRRKSARMKRRTKRRRKKKNKTDE